MTKWLELVFRGGLGLLQGILRDAVAKISRFVAETPPKDATAVGRVTA